jgi:hypothetical protein
MMTDDNLDCALWLPVGILASLNQIKVAQMTEEKRMNKKIFYYWTRGNMLTWRTDRELLNQSNAREMKKYPGCHLFFLLSIEIKKFTFKRFREPRR